MASRRVLLIGVGEMGALTARHMIERGAQQLTIANRTFSRAEALSQELCGRPAPLDRLPECLVEADIVISCTGAAQPIVEHGPMAEAVRQRGGRPLYIIDIAVPRDFDPAIGDLDGVFLHDLDDMNILVDRNLSNRRVEIPKAETIVEQELESYTHWRRSLAATPVIKMLRQKIESLRTQELRRHQKRFCKEDREQADRLTESLVNKILHPLMQQVRTWSEDGNRGALRIDSLYEAFDLERPPAERERSQTLPAVGDEALLPSKPTDSSDP